MGVNFPSSPLVGQLCPNPAVAGLPQYVWDGQAWVSGASASAAANSVFAVADFGSDNSVLRSDGTAKGAQASNVYIDDNGQLGIGTAAPSTKLTIRPTAYTLATDGIKFESYDNATHALLQPIKVAAGAMNLMLAANCYVNPAGNIGLFNGAAAGAFVNVRANDGGVQIGTGPAGGPVLERMFVTSAGDVGIGISAPAMSLHVYRNASGQYGAMRIESGSSASYAPRLSIKDARPGGREYQLVGEGPSLNIYDGQRNAYPLAIDASGNVGINTTGPARALHVNVGGWNARFGVSSGIYLDLSDNQVQALNNGAASPLYLNWTYGGTVNIGAANINGATTLNGGATANGNINTAVATGNIDAGGPTNSIMVLSNTPTNPSITFHRQGAFAMNFGMDNAGNLAFGGWSHGGGVSYQLWSKRDFSYMPVSKTGDTMSGSLSITSGALYLNGWNSSTNQGIVFLNANQDRYLHYNGGSYQMPGATLVVGGDVNCSNVTTGNVTSSGQITQNGYQLRIGATRGDCGIWFSSGDRYLYFDGGAQFYLNGNFRNYGNHAIDGSSSVGSDVNAGRALFCGSSGAASTVYFRNSYYIDFDGSNWAWHTPPSSKLNFDGGWMQAWGFYATGVFGVEVQSNYGGNPYFADGAVIRNLPSSTDIIFGGASYPGSWYGGRITLVGNRAYEFRHDNAYKPGGGSWGDNSDERIKTVEADYTLGLAAILSLKPVVYTFRGNDTDGPPLNYHFSASQAEIDAAPKTKPETPFRNSGHYRDALERRRHVGLLAQNTEVVFPNTISKRKGFIDGVEVDDLRDFDVSEITYALINAVRDLNDRIDHAVSEIGALKAKKKK